VTETLREIALSAAEVQEILAQCGSSALLVGGQALALWAVYFDVEPVGVLSAPFQPGAPDPPAPVSGALEMRFALHASRAVQ
jgi:hypothetical protein